MEKKQGFTHDNKNNMTVDWYTPPSLCRDTTSMVNTINSHIQGLKRIVDGI